MALIKRGAHDRIGPVARASQARVLLRAKVLVVAAHAIGCVRIAALAGARVADAGHVALIGRAAHDRIGSSAIARLARVRHRARVAVAALGPIRLGSVPASARDRVAGVVGARVVVRAVLRGSRGAHALIVASFCRRSGAGVAVGARGLGRQRVLDALGDLARIAGRDHAVAGARGIAAVAAGARRRCAGTGLAELSADVLRAGGHAAGAVNCGLVRALTVVATAVAGTPAQPAGLPFVVLQIRGEARAGEGDARSLTRGVVPAHAAAGVDAVLQRASHAHRVRRAGLESLLRLANRLRVRRLGRLRAREQPGSQHQSPSNPLQAIERTHASSSRIGR